MLRASSSIGVKRLDLGGGGGGRKDVLIMVGLGVVILGALVVAVLAMFSKGGDRDTGPAEPMRFKCSIEECGHEWVPTEEELKDQRKGPMMATIRLKCPKCGDEDENGNGTADQMTKCPKCGVWFVPAHLKSGNDMPPGQARIICPECKIDVQKYLHEQRKKNR